MIDLNEFLWVFSIVSLLLCLLRSLREAISMASSLALNSPLSSPSPSYHPLSWVGQFFVKQAAGGRLVPLDHHSAHDQGLELNDKVQSLSVENIQEYQKAGKRCKVLMSEGSADMDSLEIAKVAAGSGAIKGGAATLKLRKRPAMLVVPDNFGSLELTSETERKLEKREFEVEGRDFVLACKRGRREVMEDGYGVMVDILGDPKQAFFAVIDGHGGKAAVDFVAENLGRNIVKALGNEGERGVQLEHAIRVGYQVTDRDFLSQGVGSGACAASVLLKDGEVHVANVGDCRVVLSRKGVAGSLTKDHRLSREDERHRIENAGGFVLSRNGVWRVQGSLAVSRAIGDLHLKDWIISEPEIKKLPLTSDCEFLIIASDGLWDKVNEQEAVDVVSRDQNSKESCKKLIEISSSRGSLDDITVMVINLQKFVTNSPCVHGRDSIDENI